MPEKLLKGVQDGIADLFSDGTFKKNDEASHLTTNNNNRHNPNNNNPSYIHPYTNLSKSSVLQSTRAFHDSSIVHNKPNDVIAIMGKLLTLQNSNDSTESLSVVEATDVFFASTKLFISTNARLKRMIYLFLKDITPRVDPSDVIIVTSCLTKDMTCSVDLYRANALRTLVHIIDSAMLGALERYIKQAIIDPSPIVASSALVSSLHFYRSSSECASIVRRWVREIRVALDSGSHMVQMHAVQLMYVIKQNDRLAVSKFVQNCCPPVVCRITRVTSSMASSPQHSTSHAINTGNTSNNNNGSTTTITDIQSPLALLCLIRYTTKLLHDELTSGRANLSSTQPLSNASQLCTITHNILTSALHNRSEMVQFEAARALCTLPTTNDGQEQTQELQPALDVLQLLLSSPKPTTRMAAVKTLHTLSQTHPRAVSKFNHDLEGLLGDTNRLIGTLSITTLLRTASKPSIDRLLLSVATFLKFIADEYKIMVVQSLETVCVSYPEVHTVVTGFMSRFLREEGGFRFKTAIVVIMEGLMRSVPESTNATLLHLCEFIEDCEFVRLSTQILHLVGELGPTSAHPARYIRFVFNRVILENAMVRAAAVSVLGKFGAGCGGLIRRSVVVLLSGVCLEDECDEVRERAGLVLMALELAEGEDVGVGVERISGQQQEEQLQGTIHHKNLLDAEEEEAEEAGEDSATFLLLTQLPCSFDNLRQRLELYQTIPGAMERSETLSLDVLPVVVEQPQLAIPSSVASSPLLLPTSSSQQQQQQQQLQNQNQTHPPKKQLDASAILYAIPEFATFGKVFRSSTAVPLTENEAEYVVHCIKHIYEETIVLQFIVENTIEDQQLSNVFVAVDTDGSELVESTGEIPADTIAYGTSASCFAVFRRDVEVPLAAIAIVCELKFMVTRVDLDTGDVEEGDTPLEEEYTLEDVQINVSDYIVPTPVRDFRRSWANAAGGGGGGDDNDGEVLQKFSLRQKKLEETIATVVECLGLQVCDGTSRVRPGARQHMIHLSGTFMGGVAVLARAQVSIGSSSDTTVLKIAVRSKSAAISKMVAESVS